MKCSTITVTTSYIYIIASIFTEQERASTIFIFMPWRVAHLLHKLYYKLYSCIYTMKDPSKNNINPTTSKQNLKSVISSSTSFVVWS